MIALLWSQILRAESPYWYLLPLVAVVSLVYSATRQEEWPLIWRRAIRLAFFICIFMLVALAILLGIQLF